MPLQRVEFSNDIDADQQRSNGDEGEEDRDYEERLWHVASVLPGGSSAVETSAAGSALASVAGADGTPMGRMGLAGYRPHGARGYGTRALTTGTIQTAYSLGFRMLAIIWSKKALVSFGVNLVYSAVTST